MGKYAGIVQSVRNAFESGRTKEIGFREQQLQNFLRFLNENTDEFLKALKTDLNKSKQETILMEISINVMETKIALENLKSWCQPEKPPKKFLNVMDEVLVCNDPYGVALVIGAWNYPLQVSLGPMISAIAAGNCVILKPSELACATARIIAELLPKYLDNDCYKIVLGDATDVTELLEERFDYIFFTGSPRIGKIVHAAANKFLTPTTLELGGKSPVIIDKTADMEVAARRILWGKCMNAGQTCIAPDYIMCEKEVAKKFIEKSKSIIREWYGTEAQESPDLGRIINDNHYQRLVKLIDKEKIVIGGEFDATERYIKPTILDDVKENDSIMQDEIFGPILPIIYVESVQDAVKYINSKEKPLALYLFSTDKKTINFTLHATSSGGVTVNDTVMHAAVDNVPFGGVGNSGMGSYHGKYGFDTFVHKKTVLIRNLGSVGEKIGSVLVITYNGFFVPDCNHRYNSGCKMLSFPKDSVLKGKWLKVIRMADATPNKFSLVCDCHFVGGNKENLPTLFQRNFNTAVTSPCAVVRKRPKMSSKENENPASQSTIEISRPSTSSVLTEAENLHLKDVVNTLQKILEAVSFLYETIVIKGNI
ncbi:hypothetical protein FQA39_LY04247 [Lamprigera yunnana]|nr:hypothetical protein FQA39_LY04247 [Lamprigera yunnana]